MTLLSPWWLLLVPLLYVVIILHTLHPERHRVLVPSTLLWQRVLRELAADARWRRLVANLLLLCQLAALACLILALTQPALLLPASRGRHDVILIDTSASMKATDVSPNRLQAVKDQLLEHVRHDRPRRMTVIDAGPQPTICYQGSGSVAALQALLGKITATDGTTDWYQTAVLMRSSLTPGDNKVIIATDGAIDYDSISPLLSLIDKTPVQFVQAAERGANVAITAFDARQLGASLADHEVLVTLTNHTAQDVQVPLVVSGSESEVLQRRQVRIPAGENRSVTFYHTFSTQEVLKAEIHFADALAADNRAYLTAYPPTPTRILLVGPGNYFLEQGLRIFPQVRLERRLLYPETSDYDLVIFDRLPMPEDFQGTALYWAGTPADRALGTWASPRIVWWDRAHPLTRFVNWSDIGLVQSYLMARQPGALLLVESEGGPLVQLTENDQARILRFSFALDESNWPHKIAFPVFLSQMLQWAHPEGWQFVRSPLTPGESITLPPSLRRETGWQLRTPDGKIRPQRGASFDNTLTAGLYTVFGADDHEYSFAVNAGDFAESNLRPRLSIPKTVATPDGGDTQTHTPTSLWRCAALLALLLLIVETWLYTNKARRPASLAWSLRDLRQSRREVER